MCSTPKGMKVTTLLAGPRPSLVVPCDTTKGSWASVGASETPPSLHRSPYACTAFWFISHKPQGRGSPGLPLLIARPCGCSGSKTHPGQAAPGFLPPRTQVKGRCWWLPVSLHFIMCSEKVEMVVSTSLPGPATNSTQDVVLGLSAQRTPGSTEPDFPPKLSDQELHFQET